MGTEDTASHPTRHPVLYMCVYVVATGAYPAVTQTEEWEEVGTEDIAPHPTKHPVLQLVMKRAKEGSLPSHRSDSAKLGLVVEGACEAKDERGVLCAVMVDHAIITPGQADCHAAVQESTQPAQSRILFLSSADWAAKKQNQSDCASKPCCV